MSGHGGGSGQAEGHPHEHGSFDERAATWDDDPGKVERARTFADAIRAAVPLGAGMRLLEYGAGTGLVTQALAADVGPVTLADTSHGMLDVVRAKIASGALPSDARAWALDLSADEVPDERFDLVVSAMALHHIPDTDRVLAAFAALLDAGGWLCVADLEAEDGSFHGEGFEGHHGFDRDALAAQLAAAGFGDIAFSPAGELVKEQGRYPLFLAACRRAPR